MSDKLKVVADIVWPDGSVERTESEYTNYVALSDLQKAIGKLEHKATTADNFLHNFLATFTIQQNRDLAERDPATFAREMIAEADRLLKRYNELAKEWE